MVICINFHIEFDNIYARQEIVVSRFLERLAISKVQDAVSSENL